MTFSVHLEEDVFRELDRIAKESGKTRNSVVRQAVKEWLNQRRRASWPDSIVAFKGIKGFPRAEQLRSDLKPPRDPLDEVPH